MITYEFTKYADRQLQKLPLEVQRRIIKKIKYYIDTGNPIHYADSVKGEQQKVYRFRIGDYRIIFDWNGSLITVIKISPRPRAY